MDSKRIDGAGSPNIPVPRSTPGTALALPAPETLLENSKLAEEVCEVKPVDFWIHPKLFSGLRGSFYPAEGIRKFLDWQKSKLYVSQDKRFEDILAFDPTVSEILEDLKPVFSKSGLDLVLVLKNLLVNSSDFEDKAIIVKSLFSLGREDGFLSEYLVPILEKKSGLKNLENNYEFSTRLLSLAREQKLQETLQAIDYCCINNINDFASSLVRIKDPDFILDNLMTVSERLKLDESKGRDLEKVQRIALAVMKILDESSAPLPADHLTNLYKTAVTYDIGKEVAVLISKHFQADSTRIYKEQMFDHGNGTDEDRKKCFYALANYVSSTREHAVPTLKDILCKEEDPFIIGYATYALATSCAIDGKRTLVDLIVKQIRDGKPSVALAAVTQMSKYGEPYLATLKGLFYRTFQSDKGLKHAYLDFANTKVSLIEKGGNGGMTFSLGLEEMPDLVLNLIENIGLKTFAKWATVGEGKTLEQKENFKTNAMDVLECGFEMNPGKLNCLLVESLSVDDSRSTEILLKKLAGMGNYSDN